MNRETNHWCPKCKRRWGHPDCEKEDLQDPDWEDDCHNCMQGDPHALAEVRESDGPMWYRDEFLEMIWEVQDANKSGQ